ncbi:arabinan endo-1,5-alpha-L-arabinosidase [Pontibacter toksunensis]|uniref:Arabinan endo-1,5-alpha-L-arabinosidase n=1 Tax=Pontibacter toksunensis TaxID=1332631 RepID=A0ABW6C1M7_9BACT
MANSNFNLRLLLPIILMLLVGNTITLAQSRDVVVHDPVMIKQNDTYYVFHTGEGIHVKSSKDMKNWKAEKPVFASTPEWVTKMIPKFDGNIWAPDIIHHNGTYYLYYSVSSFGRNNSAIAVATNKTLNPKDPNFKWVDKGIVIQSVPGRDMWNAIDANVIFDDKGTPWMTFGSFWQGIKLVKLNPDMMSVATGPDQSWQTIAARERNWLLDERDAGDAANPELDYEKLYTPEMLEQAKNMKNGSIEAPFLFKKNGYYYLFMSWDRCCRGLESTYKVLVGRSKDITGPYLDKEGKKLAQGGGTLVAQGNEEWAAAGHPAAYTFDGKDYLIFHAYDKKDEGKPKLRIKEIKWGKDNWPTITMKE